MKVVLALAVLAIAAVTDSAVLTAGSRNNVVTGGLTGGDRHLYWAYAVEEGVDDTVLTQDVVFVGNSTTSISLILAYEVGPSQDATAAIVSGGLGQNAVTVRLTSAKGNGFMYRVSVWGKD